MLNVDDLNIRKKYNEILKKLYKNNVDSCDLIGVITFFIYSKQIFPKNKEICEFIQDVFECSYPQYVIRSRTLIVAKITRYIYIMEERDLLNIMQKLTDALQKLVNNLNADEGVIYKVNRKRNENNKMNTWLKGL